MVNHYTEADLRAIESQGELYPYQEQVVTHRSEQPIQLDDLINQPRKEQSDEPIR